MGAHPLHSALSQRWLLDPVKQAYNQSQLDGWLKLTASTFKQLWISIPEVVVNYVGYKLYIPIYLHKF